MKIAYFGNNFNGFQVLEFLRKRGEELAVLVVHKPDDGVFRDEIIKASGLEPAKILEWDPKSPLALKDRLQELGGDMLLSVNFGFYIPPEVFRLYPMGAYNLHTALLPYNRGEMPNVWAIVDGTPAGVTLHEIDEGIDSGGIVFQVEVPVAPFDTGETLYHKLERASLELMEKNWDRIKNGTAPRGQPPRAKGTYHWRDDVGKIDRIDLDKSYTAGELIDFLRARTFPPYRGCYFQTPDGRKIYMELKLIPEQDK